jgi:methionyl-tRNA formyltransferase
MNPKDLRILFMGTPEFAVESLKALIENGYNIVGVVTAPDKPAGRGRSLNESAVKIYAKQQNLKILQPEKLKSPDFLFELENMKADLQVVVAFRMLPEIVWSRPPLGTFNLHASLLPQYRGAAPINWAIINDEHETGLTTFLLSHEIDTGQIIFQEKISIGENDNAGDLHDRMMVKGAMLVIKTVETIATKNLKAIDQNLLIGNALELKHAPKIFKDDCRIDWNKNAGEVRNLIRGLSPYPAAWTELIHPTKPEILIAKIFTSTVDGININSVPGTLFSDGKKVLKVACGNAWLSINEIQLSGKKRLKTDELLRGFKEIGEWKVKPFHEN